MHASGCNLLFSDSKKFVSNKISDRKQKKEETILMWRFPLLSQRRPNSKKFHMIYGLSPVNEAFCNKQDGRFEEANGHSFMFLDQD